MHKSIYDRMIFLLHRSGKPLNRIAMTMLMVLLLHGCARQAFPGGGPKDVAPPVPQTATPPHETSNFRANSFFIGFDEYVVLKGADNNVVVSPPLKHKPKYSTKGHGLQVTLRDTLLPNTTYHFSFLDAVADFNEGNLLHRMDYVFSTGAAIDSFSLGGSVLDALNGTVWKEPVTVALYRAASTQGLQRHEVPPTVTGDTALATVCHYSVGGVADSILAKELPSYVTRCDSSGTFRFSYLRPDNYRMIAFADGNRNQRLDEGEAVAFLDTIVPSEYMAPPLPRDTTLADSLQHRLDSLQQQEAQSMLRWHLHIFAPQLVRQHLSSPTMPRKGYAEVPTALPVQQPAITSLADSIVWILNDTRDTVRIWSSSHPTDSLWLVLHDPTGLQDTVKLRYRTPHNSKTPGNRAGTAGRSNATNNHAPAIHFGAKAKFDFYDTLQLLFANPTKPTDTAIIHIYNLSDSSETKAFAHRCDTLGLKTLIVDSTGLPFRFAPGNKYRCLLLPDNFIDLYGNGNDTVECSFETTTENQYGNLQVEFSAEVSSPFVLQLLDGQGNVVRQQALTQGEAHFLYLAPERYTLRAIEDSNDNGRWDTGDLRQHRQPERTFFYSKTMEVRANWNFNETWHIDNCR